MRFFRNNWYWVLAIGIGISSVTLIQHYQPQTSETGKITPGIADHIPDTANPQPGAVPGGHLHNCEWHDDTPHTQEAIPKANLKRTAKSVTQKNLPLRQWKHGPHIGHHHPPQKPTPDPLDYGLSQEQIDRTKERLASAEWYEYGDDDRFYIYLNEEKRKGKTDEEIAEQINREKVDIFTAEMDAINAFKYLTDIYQKSSAINVYQCFLGICS